MSRFEGIMTGYIAHGEQTDVVRDAVERVKDANPRASMSAIR